MADLIGIIKSSRGTQGGMAESSKITRLSSREIEVEANGWNTFVKVHMKADGSTVIDISRELHKRGEKIPLTTITLNSESAESPRFSADGLLREQIKAEG